MIREGKKGIPLYFVCLPKALSMVERFRGLFKQIGSSVQAKITLPYILLSIIVAIGGAYLISQLLVNAVDRRFKNSLIETAKISADLLVQEEDSILEIVRLIANSKDIDHYILEENAEELRNISLPLAFNTDEDMIDILNTEGITLLSLHKDDSGRYPVYVDSKGSDVFAEVPFIQKVLSADNDNFGDKFAGILYLERQQFLYIAGPIMDEDEHIIGAILVGRNLDEFISEVRLETLSQVSVYQLDGERVVSTLPWEVQLPSDEAKEIVDTQDELSYVRSFQTTDIGYLELLYPFEIREKADIGIIGVAISTSFLSEANTSIRHQVFTLIAVLLFLTIIVGLTIARMITRPIDRLKDAALEVSMGNLDIEVEPIGEDEIAVLTSTFNQMVGNLKKSNRTVLDAYNSTLEGWSKALEMRDQETEGHTLRVTDLTMALAEKYGFNGDALENIRRGSLIHDVGKFAVPDKVLLKPGNLTKKEFEIMKLHPEHARDMLSGIPFLQGAIDIPYCHHEHWDGSGYPRGLKGEEIPIAARIFAVADVWDAVTTDRPYREAMPRDEAIKVIKEGSGTHFDPAVVDLFLEFLEDQEEGG
jgi:HD-GYP domain-containing protein (c-di-GMP phosphodiesterase class II)